MSRAKPVRKLVAPFCTNEFHGRCSGLIREARTTPKGQDLRQLLCACKCHVEPRRAAS